MQNRVFVGIVIGFLFVALCAGLRTYDNAYGQQTAAYEGSPMTVSLSQQPPRWLVVSAESANKESQFVTVLVPELQKICVYEVNLKDGALTLRSVRPVHFDLQIDVFNGKGPLPQEIEQMLKQSTK